MGRRPGHQAYPARGVAAIWIRSASRPPAALASAEIFRPMREAYAYSNSPSPPPTSNDADHIGELPFPVLQFPAKLIDDNCRCRGVRRQEHVRGVQPMNDAIRPRIDDFINGHLAHEAILSTVQAQQWTLGVAQLVLLIYAQRLLNAGPNNISWQFCQHRIQASFKFGCCLRPHQGCGHGELRYPAQVKHPCQWRQ